MNRFLFQIHIAILFWFVAASSNASVIMHTGFEHQEAGTPMTRDLWQAEGFQPASWDNGLQKRTKIDDSIANQGIHSLRIMYPKDEFGTTNTGCQISLLFPSHDEMYASYSLRFSENFSWGTTNYGGKLPGLAGGENCSGGRNCDGTNGWSARFMWRSGGKLILYLYDMLKPDTYGLDIQLTYPDGTPVIAERGKWYHITERVKMNSAPDKADGEVQAWVNGEEVLLLTGRQFTTCDVKIDNFYISTFHGGDDEGWCPTDTCYTYLDDILIGTSYEDVCFQTCQKPNIGPDQSLCVIGEACFNVDMPKDYTLRWTKDGKEIAQGNTFSTTTPGQYIVIADSAHCSQNDTVNVLEKLEVQLQETHHICSSSFITLNTQMPQNKDITFQWQRDGETITQANEPTLTIKDAGIYTVSVSAKDCETATGSTIVTSGLLSADDIMDEAGKRIELSLQEEGNFKWTDEEGNLIGYGNSQSITMPSGEHYIYVEDEDGFIGNVGKKQLTENAWTRNNFDKEFMQFTVERELTIDSISIYPTKELDATLHIIDEEDNTILFCKTYNNLKGGDEARLPIGVKLKAGHYHIDAIGTTAPLYHSHTDSDIQFPYTIEGLISLTGCNLDWINNKGWYMLFYNWHISAGNHCAATPIKLTGASTSNLNKTANNSFVITQSENNLIIKGLKKGQFIHITDAQGYLLKKFKVESTDLTINTEHWADGVYIVEGRKVVVRR